MDQALLATEEGTLLHLGAGMLTYVKRELYHLVGFPPGKGKKDDLFCSLIVAKQSCLLSLGVIGNDEVQPILKQLGLEFPEESVSLLDTVFCGHEVKVEVRRPPAEPGTKTALRAEVTIGGQSVRCLLQEAESSQDAVAEAGTLPGMSASQLILADDQGIFYFHRTEQALSPERQREECDASLEYRGGASPTSQEILNGTPFGARLLDLPTGQFHLSHVLKPALWDELRALETDGEPHACCWNEHGLNQLVVAKKERIPGAGEAAGIISYRLWDSASVRDDYEELGQVYRLLEKGDSRKSESVSTSFRLWGKDMKIQRVSYLLQKASRTNSTILLTGESGTGKTFLAREIHRNSRRKDAGFIHVNCASIPYNLIESELFGYEEGAFTGAKRGGKPGFFEMAHGGTLFLDEITELPLALQGRLLEALQSKTFFKVGGSEKVTVDIRLIAATNRNLQKLVEEGRFREDLFYRINVFPVELPPLRERRRDLFSLIMAILPEICQRAGIEPLQISPEAIEKADQYPWPGNIRELENVLEKAAILSDGKLLRAEDILLPEELAAGKSREAGTLKAQREAFEARIIRRTLKEFGGERQRTAEVLGISRTSLFEKMRKYGIEEHGEDDR